MTVPLSFRHGTDRVELTVSDLILTGFGGRDPVHINAHIAEMTALGVKPPLKTPCFYPVNPALLSQSAEITVYGHDTAFEVEFVLFASGGQQFVTVGNDQFDLEVERLISAEKGKNLCMKSVADEAWVLSGVLQRWDELQLQLFCDGRKFQEALVRELLHPEVLLDLVESDCGTGGDGRVIFSGTIPLLAKAPSAPYKIEINLTDPLCNRTIHHSFRVNNLSAL